MSDLNPNRCCDCGLLVSSSLHANGCPEHDPVCVKVNLHMDGEFECFCAFARPARIEDAAWVDRWAATHPEFAEEQGRLLLASLREKTPVLV